MEEITFTPAMKEELAYPVRAVMEERAIKIPLTKEIRSDLRGVKKEHTASGNIRFTADTGPDGHSDRLWALPACTRLAAPPSTDMCRLIGLQAPLASSGCVQPAVPLQLPVPSLLVLMLMLAGHTRPGAGCTVTVQSPVEAVAVVLQVPSCA